MKSFGASHDVDDIERLTAQAHAFIHEQPRQGRLLATVTPETMAVERFVGSLHNANIRTIGPELIFGTLFDRIGFNAIPEALFRHVVIARLAFPSSKRKTVDYLYRYRGMVTDVSSVYRFLDRLTARHKTIVERIAYEHTKKTLTTISVVFYDMTTLYFEAEDEDDLRKIGFSKDGKFDCPQIMLGLLIGEGGYPIGYDIFEGNTYEGKTLIPTLTALQEKYGFAKPIVVADAGLLSKKNIEELMENEYTFILGARIKNESDAIKATILERTSGLRDGESMVIEKDDGTRLVVTFSRRRIEAHLCIAFVAYTIWKELERLLKEAGIEMSAKRAGELTHTMYALDYVTPGDMVPKRTVLRMDGEQQILYEVIQSQ